MTFPPDAKLTLDLERFVLGSGYYLHMTVVIDPLKTIPAELEKSLLIRLRTATQPEVLARVCARTDLAAYPEIVAAPVVPYEFHLLKLGAPEIQAAMASITVGDDIIISPIPDLWAYMGWSTFTATVQALGGTGTDYVIASLNFPSFFTGLTFQIKNGTTVIASGVDGITSRHNPGAYMYCRVGEDYTGFTDLSEAINKLEAVRSEALGLVKDYERSDAEFEGDTEELFT